MFDDYYSGKLAAEVEGSELFTKVEKKELAAMVKEIVGHYAKKLDEEIRAALLRGENPIVVVPGGEPWNAYVVDVSEVYLDESAEVPEESFWGDSVLTMMKRASAAANVGDPEDQPETASPAVTHDWSKEKLIPSEWAPVNEEREVEEEDHGPFDDLPDESPDEVLDHPEHYTTSEIPSGIECWDHYELGMTEEEFRGAMKNNIYKYTFRAGRKSHVDREVIEQAHMAGQANAGVDPSYSEARAYYDSILPELQKKKRIEDLGKMIRYLQRWIKFEEGERIVWMKGKKA